MKFRVYSAEYEYDDSKDLHEHYPELLKYGHEFEITEFDHSGNPIGKNYIHLYSLEELNELIEMLKNRINTDKNYYDANYFNGLIVDIDKNKERSIYIYDDCIK